MAGLGQHLPTISNPFLKVQPEIHLIHRYPGIFSELKQQAHLKQVKKSEVLVTAHTASGKLLLHGGASQHSVAWSDFDDVEITGFPHLDIF